MKFSLISLLFTSAASVQAKVVIHDEAIQWVGQQYGEWAQNIAGTEEGGAVA